MNLKNQYHSQADALEHLRAANRGKSPDRVGPGTLVTWDRSTGGEAWRSDERDVMMMFSVEIMEFKLSDQYGRCVLVSATIGHKAESPVFRRNSTRFLTEVR